MIWTVPLALILRIPGIYHLGRSVYQYIAGNRSTERCTDETCGYNPPALPADDASLKLLMNFTLRDLKITALFAGLFILIFFQLIVSMNASAIKKVRQAGVLNSPLLNNEITDFSQSVKSFAKPVLGITNHPVFMDFHFKNYNHLIAVAYQKDNSLQFLPIINGDGLPGTYLQGPLYVNWTFRVNSALIDSVKLAEGIKRYTAFWARQNNYQLKNLSFTILVKKIDDYQGWEKDFLNTQLDRSWQAAGTSTWRNGNFSSSIVNIESIQ